MRTTLLAQRATAARQVDHLTQDWEQVVSAQSDIATDDEHDPEGSTIAYERAKTAALLDQARQRLAAADRALDRLSAGTFGTCVVCGAPIAPERLAARPTADRCLTCANAR